jgi:hypothetical protein
VRRELARPEATRKGGGLAGETQDRALLPEGLPTLPRTFLHKAYTDTYIRRRPRRWAETDTGAGNH